MARIGFDHRDWLMTAMTGGNKAPVSADHISRSDNISVYSFPSGQFLFHALFQEPVELGATRARLQP
jgi:hypothetical protein